MHLIVGASGTVGTRVVRRLLDRGDVVRGVSRDLSRLDTLRRLGAVPISGDLRSAAWMAVALEGVRSLILTSHGLVPPTRHNHPGLVDDAGNRRIIDAARQAGVERIVFISAAAVAGHPTLFTAAKHRVEDHLRSAGVSYSIIRPSVFIETHALLLIAEPLRAKGSVTFLGPGTAPLNWISADDVAEYVVRAVDSPHNSVDVIGGPDHMSRRQVLAIIEKVLGRRARRTHVPVSVMRVMRTVVGSVHPGMRYLLDVALAETKARPEASPADLDWTGPTSVAEVIERWARSQ
jgi:uncharacterized protein YbjT (DUF2867 family)